LRTTLSRFPLVAAVAAFASISTAQTAGSSFLGTRWNKPGPNNAVNAPAFGNGESNWSEVAAGIGLAPLAPDPDHPGGALTYNFDGLLGPAAPRRPAQIFQDALNKWMAASGNAWKDLGKVVDGGGLIGGNVQAMSGVGDMRVAVLDWINNTVPSFQPNMDILAHAFKPDTIALNSIAGFGSLGGDVHFRPSKLQDANGIDWVDSLTPGAGQFDLETVMLHEIGHALGLGHNNLDVNSVMQPVYGGVRRGLSADDITNIKELYTPPAAPVPEPASMAALGLGAAALLRRRKRA